MSDEKQEVLDIQVFEDEVYPVYFANIDPGSAFGTRTIRMTRQDYEQFKAAESAYNAWQTKIGDMYDNEKDFRINE